MGKNCAVLHLTSLLAAGLISGSLPGQAAVVESTTDMFVAKAKVIQGTVGPSPKVSYLSLPALSSAVYAGEITSLGSGTLTDANAQWLPGQFNGANGSFYIHFESGHMADILQTDAGTKTLTYPGTLPQGVSVGDQYKIRKHRTLASIFGIDNSAGLRPGSNTDEADNVLVHAAETQQTLTYFFSSVPGYPGWYRSDYAPANNTVIYPEQGLMVRRKTTGNLTLYLRGPTQNCPTQAPVYDGYNLVGILKSTGAWRLSDLNLFTGDPNTGLAPGSNLNDADNLILINPDSTTTTCFYSDYPGWEGWYDASFSPAGSVTIPSGTPFFVHRKASRGLFHWSIPEE